MSINRIRGILAILVVGIFMLITGFMAIYALIGRPNVDIATYSDFFSKTSSVYTGIIGVIIGYYFARSKDLESDKTKD